MENFQKLFEGVSNPYDARLEKMIPIAKRWEKFGLLEGLSTKREKLSMAGLLENQAKQILKEQSGTGTAALGSNTYSAEQWAGVALPLVRKVFAQISSKDFVSVQPMNLPSGLVFYLDFKYGTTKSPFAARENMYGTLDLQDQDPTGGLYGAGRFGYSINNVTASVVVASGSAVSASIDYQDGLLPSDYLTFAVATSSLSGVDVEGIRAIQLESGSNNPVQVSKFTKLSGANIEFVVSASDVTLDVTGGFTGSLVYQVQPNDNSRGDFEDNPAGSISIPEIDVELKSKPIVAKTRKLKAQWTPEFSQDLDAYHALDAEAELTGTLSEFISAEIDLEIIDMLIQNARTTERWSAKSNTFWENGAWTEKAAGAGGYYNTQGEWFQTIGTKLQKVSNKIHQKTLRGGANFLVCSPNVATILESIPGFAANTDGDKMEFAMGVQKVGQIQSRWNVYKNPYMLENKILMGFRGSQFLETGAVYAPYIPLMMTPLVYDPETFTPRKGIMTRYAKEMVRPEFYGLVHVANVDTI